ncbi:1-deoxy-D-xylulose-5-phosphate synthase [Eubacterium sulci ATCC 35585]|nr:1-deoxy-D-xylulose-5-phosphate synthase [Eubacterium sulci ATCC 35585]EUC78338.1 1-deoxy-D-xylulose-5-phosphate synthase [Eubacterium sulci ATCC 35585]
MSNHIKDYKLPEDIKSMDENSLELLSTGIRAFLIDTISKTGGHLASNLGVVEISVGLHRIFDFPKDKLIWDVGHQSYIHKILTGRADQFSTLRQNDGMSGFPKRSESEYDVYDTGHSSTSISAAMGLAVARDLNKSDEEVIAVIGDGAMTGGPSFEALNNLGSLGSKVIIVLNDNGMSISEINGGLSEHLSKLRTSSEYQNTKNNIKKAINKIPDLGKPLSKGIAGLKRAVKYAIFSGGVIFEELGITYLGPFDGNNMSDVLRGLNQAKNAPGPVLVHFKTKKGKGYKQAEQNPDKFHGIGAFDKETGVTLSKSQTSYSEIFGKKMFELAEKNDKLVALTAAMCTATGLDQMRDKYPKRVFDVGIAEAHACIFAAGLALGGMHPVVAIYSSFLQRAYDEIIEDVCLQKLPVTFAIDRAGIVGADGETHHGIFDLSYLLPLPNMTVLAPCDAHQLEDMLEYAISKDAPFAIRYPRGSADMTSHIECSFELKNNVISEGKDVNIIAVGTMLNKAIKASEILKEQGIDAKVCSASVLKPFDDSIIDSSDKLIVTLEDNLIRGGFGEYIAANYTNRVVKLGWPDKFIEHGDCEYLYKKYGLDAESIAERIRQELEGKA